MSFEGYFGPGPNKYKVMDLSLGTQTVETKPTILVAVALNDNMVADCPIRNGNDLIRTIPAAGVTGENHMMGMLEVTGPLVVAPDGAENAVVTVIYRYLSR